MLADPGGLPGDGRVGEDLVQRDVGAELGGQAQGEAGGQQRVAAEGEEVVVDAEVVRVVAEEVGPDRRRSRARQGCRVG